MSKHLGARPKWNEHLSKGRIRQPALTARNLGVGFFLRREVRYGFVNFHI